MSEVFWQAKIWGLLYGSPLKALHKNARHSENSPWQHLDVMRTWKESGWNSEASSNPVLKHIYLANLIVSASDRHLAADVSIESIVQSPIATKSVRTLQILVTHV